MSQPGMRFCNSQSILLDRMTRIWGNALSLQLGGDPTALVGSWSESSQRMGCWRASTEEGRVERLKEREGRGDP